MAYQRDMASVRSTLQTRWRLNDETVFEGGIYGTWKDLDHPIFQVVDQQSRNYGVFGRFDWTGRAFGKAADAFYGVSYRSGDLDANQWINLAGSHGAHTARSRQNATGLDVFAEGRLFVTDRLAVVAGRLLRPGRRDYQSYALPGQSASFNLTTGKDLRLVRPAHRPAVAGRDGLPGLCQHHPLGRAAELLGPVADGARVPAVRAAGGRDLRSRARGRRGAFTWDIGLSRRPRPRTAQLRGHPAAGIPAATFNAGPNGSPGRRGRSRLALRPPPGLETAPDLRLLRLPFRRRPGLSATTTCRSSRRICTGPNCATTTRGLVRRPFGGMVDRRQLGRLRQYPEIAVLCGGVAECGLDLRQRRQRLPRRPQPDDERYISNFSAVTRRPDPGLFPRLSSSPARAVRSSSASAAF
jgi:hypothetical protein